MVQYAEQGEPKRMVDMAERQHIRKVPMWRSEDFRAIVTSNADAMVVLDRGGSVLYVNPAAEALFGLAADEMVGVKFGFPILLEQPVVLDILRGFKDFVSAEMRLVEVVWAGEPSYLLSFRDLTDRIKAEQAVIQARDGLEAMVEERTRELSEANERLRSEVAERMLVEDKLRENYRFTSLLMGNLPGMVFRCRYDEDWTMEFVSRGCNMLTGYKVDDLFNNKKIAYFQLVHPDDRERVRDEVKLAFSGNKPFVTTYRITTASGEMKWVWTKGRFLFYNGKDIIEGYAFDITDSKRAEEALAETKRQVELYLDLMSHDINNMNQSALGFLELALDTLETDGKIGPDDKELVEKPLQAIQSSSTLIDNVRKLQRLMEEGVKVRPIDLHDLFEELRVRDYHVSDREVAVHFQAIPHCLVYGDELLRDVFLNLIGNAVKHSMPDRPITVNVKVERSVEGGRTYFQCTVEDDGPGVPDELKPKLFHRFQRGKTKTRGKGLGLYLVRTLVEGYGGRVWVEDRVKGDHTKGARFVVMLLAV